MDESQKSEDELLGLDSAEQVDVDPSLEDAELDDAELDDTKEAGETVEDIEEELLLLSSPKDKKEKKNPEVDLDSVNDDKNEETSNATKTEAEVVDKEKEGTAETQSEDVSMEEELKSNNKSESAADVSDVVVNEKADTNKDSETCKAQSKSDIASNSVLEILDESMEEELKSKNKSVSAADISDVGVNEKADTKKDSETCKAQPTSDIEILDESHNEDVEVLNMKNKDEEITKEVNEKADTNKVSETCKVQAKSDIATNSVVEILDESHNDDVEVLYMKNKDEEKTNTTTLSDIEVLDEDSGDEIKVVKDGNSVVEVIDDDDEDEEYDEDELEIIDDESEGNDLDSDEMTDDDNAFMDGKISIFYSHGSLFIWNADDAQMLREECRIVGKLVGCLPRAPRQNVHLGLPLQLMPEEAKLLVDIDAAVIVEETETPEKVWRVREKALKAVREENDAIQKEMYKEKRKEAIRSRMNDIIAGKKAKKRKLLEAAESSLGEDKTIDDAEGVDSGESPDKKKASSDEEDKLTPDDIPLNIDYSNESSIVQVFCENPWKRPLQPALGFKFPTTARDVLRYAVFKDLWKKGYYLTTAAKFGGDFLVYPGDPCKFHSHFIAVCLEQHQEIPMSEVLSMGRLGSNTRKTTIMCSMSRRKRVNYTSLQWTGIH